MKEQSHKDEMSAALRGDFRRLRARGVAVTLAPPEPEPSARSERADSTDSVSETVSCQDALSDASQADAGEADAEEPRGWLGRLLGR